MNRPPALTLDFDHQSDLDYQLYKVITRPRSFRDSKQRRINHATQLINDGANVNSTHGYNPEPLIIHACNMSRPELVKLLFDNGANINDDIVDIVDVMLKTNNHPELQAFVDEYIHHRSIAEITLRIPTRAAEINTLEKLGEATRMPRDSQRNIDSYLR
jgi:hypothetical protein